MIESVCKKDTLPITERASVGVAVLLEVPLVHFASSYS